MDTAVEIDNLRHVTQSEAAHEIRRGRVQHGQVILHTGAAVEE
jgi:hypothetical protein